MPEIKAEFVNIKNVMSRNTVQIILEVPIEMGMPTLNVLGYPKPDESIWVAVRKINGDTNDIDRE